MTVWGAVLVVGFCGAVVFLVEVAPRLSGRRRGGAEAAPPAANSQNVQDEKGAP